MNIKFTKEHKVTSIFPLSYLLNTNLTHDYIFSCFLSKRRREYPHTNYTMLLSYAIKMADMITSQWAEVQKQNNFENISVILMESKFKLNNNELTSDKIDKLEGYPELLGYLFYQKSRRKRLINNGYIVFGTLIKNHTYLLHKSFHRASIRYRTSMLCGGTSHYVITL